MIYDPENKTTQMSVNTYWYLIRLNTTLYRLKIAYAGFGWQELDILEDDYYSMDPNY